MLNLFSFFKSQAAEWRRDNTNRSADYVAGGIAALREASDELTAHKDVVDLEWVTNQLNAAHKENRELLSLNKAFDESRRTFQSRSDSQAKVIGQLQEKLTAPKFARKEQLVSKVAELQGRVDDLESQLRLAGQEPEPNGSALLGANKALRKELDKLRGVGRVGRHVTSLPRVLKAMRRILKQEASSAEVKLTYMERAISTSEAVLAGKLPDEWIDRPELAPANE